MRRAVLRDDDPQDEQRREEAELRALLDIFAIAHAETLEQLDRTDRTLDDALAYFAAKESQ